MTVLVLGPVWQDVANPSSSGLNGARVLPGLASVDEALLVLEDALEDGGVEVVPLCVARAAAARVREARGRQRDLSAAGDVHAVRDALLDDAGVLARDRA